MDTGSGGNIKYCILASPFIVEAKFHYTRVPLFCVPFNWNTSLQLGLNGFADEISQHYSSKMSEVFHKIGSNGLIVFLNLNEIDRYWNVIV